MLINKQPAPKPIVPPTMDECLESLGITRHDLAHIRRIKEVGMLKFCKEKIAVLESVPKELETDHSFKAFFSLVYNFFRKEYKDKRSNWKEESASTILTSFYENISELEGQSSKIEKLTSLSDMVSKAYIYYRKLLKHTNTDV